MRYVCTVLYIHFSYRTSTVPYNIYDDSEHQIRKHTVYY